MVNQGHSREMVSQISEDTDSYMYRLCLCLARFMRYDRISLCAVLFHSVSCNIHIMGPLETRIHAGSIIINDQ